MAMKWPSMLICGVGISSDNASSGIVCCVYLCVSGLRTICLSDWRQISDGPLLKNMIGDALRYDILVQ